MAALTADWARVAAPLYAARAARILHLAAAALALGVIAGLYVRGLAFEYRATWESTFLDPAQVRALLAAALAPGALPHRHPGARRSAGGGDPRAGGRERRHMAAPDRGQRVHGRGDAAARVGRLARDSSNGTARRACRSR